MNVENSLIISHEAQKQFIIQFIDNDIMLYDLCKRLKMKINSFYSFSAIVSK